MKVKVKYIDIIHHSHADYGYTDHPAIVRELQKKYIDMALDAVIATQSKRPEERFCWTSEILEPVWEWWKEADGSKRDLLLKAVDSGQFEVCGFTFNNTAFLNDDQWDKLFHWIPDELWDRLKIKSCMQTDVNGIPSAGVLRAIRKGIRYLWMGPNSYLGSVPFPQPSAFRWQTPGGADIFVWMNSGYANAYYLFNDNWRQGPVPSASDLCYRPPEIGDFFAAGREEILKAHERCVENIRRLEAQPGLQKEETNSRQIENTQFSASGGYVYERLPVSLTNQWRIDNDPPFLPVLEFVNKWNSMGLEPVLRLTTPTRAMMDLEKEIGSRIPVYSGEWVDWWAKGSISAPADMAAARKAKRIIKVLMSPLFDKTRQDEARIDNALRELCLFDEHTWGSWASVSAPYSCEVAGQMYEKGCLAYRPLAAAEFTLATSVRKHFENSPDGIYVTNTSDYHTTDWIELPSNCLRGVYTHVKDEDTGETREVIYEKGADNFSRPLIPEDITTENVSCTFRDNVDGRKARFWSGVLKPGSTKRYLPIEYTDALVNNTCVSSRSELLLEYDNTGWPHYVKWDCMPDTLFEDGFGDFISLKPMGFSPRWTIKDIFNTDDEDERMKLRNKNILSETGVYGKTFIKENSPYMEKLEQLFTHSSLVWGKRTLEVWKEEPRVRLRVKINRRSSLDPEVFFIRFPLPCKGIIPTISNGGSVFKPGEGQLPGSCMDYYAIDGWVKYESEQGCWFWSAKDSPIITFGSPKLAGKIRDLPGNMEELYAMVFDNTWDTNFVADSHGIMDFCFDIVWKKEINKKTDMAGLAASLSLDPAILVKVHNKKP